MIWKNTSLWITVNVDHITAVKNKCIPFRNKKVHSPLWSVCVCVCLRGVQEKCLNEYTVLKVFFFSSCSNSRNNSSTYVVQQRLLRPPTQSHTHLHMYWFSLCHRHKDTAISMHQLIYSWTGEKPTWKMKVQKAKAVYVAQADFKGAVE